MWLEARQAMLLAKLDRGADAAHARWALEMATREGAACLGREGELGELSVGAVADVAVWDLTGVRYAGALGDPVEAWLRCGPTSARHVLVNGQPIVMEGSVLSSRHEEILASHSRAARAIQESTA
jgi:cytosine/adenosine deaminase-related metal-dependent hydrolase